MTFPLLTLLLAAPQANYETLVKDSLSRWKTPGVVVVVVRAGQPDFVAGYGVAKLGQSAPPTPEQFFPLASCSKAFTTTLIAKLVDEGLMTWDEPLSRFTSGFALSDPSANGMLTLRDCCSHRTGLAGHDLLWYRSPWGVQESLARASKLPLDLPFRGAFRYCSLPVAAAGRAAAARAGKSWEELLAERITGPLGIRSIAFSTKDPRYLAAEKPTGHRRTAQGIEGMSAYLQPEPNPAGSLYIAPQDVPAWLKFHLNSGKPLLTPAAHAELFAANIPLRWDAELRRTNPDTIQMTYGLGWLLYDYRGHRVAAHGGKIDGFRTHIALYPDDGFALALFNNLHDTTMNQALANKIADTILSLPAKDWDQIFLQSEAQAGAEKQSALQTRAASRRNIAPLLKPEAYKGDYTHPAYGLLQVSEDQQKLIAKWGSFVVPLEHWDEEQYRVMNGFFEDQLVEFRIRQGQADAVRFAGQIFTRP